MEADQVKRTWGDAEYGFKLRLGELRDLEAARECGSVEIWRRLGTATYRVDDIVQVLRLGLIGAGMNPVLATGLVAKFVTPGKFREHQSTAFAVLNLALFGDQDDIVGKLEAEITALTELMTAANKSSTDAVGSDSRHSLDAVPQSDGPRNGSGNQPFGNSTPPVTGGDDATGRTTTGPDA